MKSIEAITLSWNISLSIGLLITGSKVYSGGVKTYQRKRLLTGKELLINNLSLQT
jgi:hypothetical protein